MKKLTTFILLLFLFSSLKAQSIDSKIDSLIMLQQKQTKYVTNTQSSLMGDLINHICNINHDGNCSSYYIPYTFNTLSNDNTTIYYQSTNVTSSKKLFYWCIKTDEDKWNINSLIIDSLSNNTADYQMKILSNKKMDVLVFTSHEANFLILNNSKKIIQRIDYSFETLSDYNFIYYETSVFENNIEWSSEGNQNISTDITLDSLHKELRNLGYSDSNEKQISLLDAIESRTKVIKKETHKNKSIYLTKLQTNDINQDNKIDYYWVAISNGKIMYFEVFNLINNKWINVSDTIDSKLFENNQDIKKQIEITK